MKDLFFAARIVVLLFASFLFGDHLLATDYSFWGGMLYILLASIGLSAFLGFLEWILDIRDSFWIAGLLLPLLGNSMDVRIFTGGHFLSRDACGSILCTPVYMVVGQSLVLGLLTFSVSHY